MKRIKYSSYLIIIIILLVELVFRFSGLFKTYSEKIGTGYYSYYGQKLPTWYHHWPKNKLNCFNQPEFNYCYQYNSLGLRDQEWQYKKAENKKRLIILGDSFTEGDGASNNNNFPSYFSKSLNAHNNSWEVYNAGVCGNDPFFNLKFYQTIINPEYEYNAIIFLVNNSDIYDYIFRGGVERFNADSTTTFRDSPWYEPIYRYSHFFRALFKIFADSNTLLSLKTRNILENEALLNMASVYKEAYNLSSKNNKKIIVIIHPFPKDIKNNTIDNDRINELEVLLKKENIPCVNIAKAAISKYDKYPYEKYAWELNGHFNDFGYKLFSDIIYEEIFKKYPYFLN